MTVLVAAPFIPISYNIHSHRAAQGVIYADMLKRSGLDVHCNLSQPPHYRSDFNEFEALYVYHGNDWQGHLNLFGGLTDFPYIQNFVNFTQFKGKVYSLAIDFPDYYEQLKHKVDLRKEKEKPINALWDNVDWENLKRMQWEAITVKRPGFVHPKIVIGDSHAICMYRPGWNIESIPFRTLHGALEIGLEKLWREFQGSTRHKDRTREVEFYFGNIDIRHHLCRQEYPVEAAKELAEKYVEQARKLQRKVGLRVGLYELLPIEDIKRTIPKTGYYLGKPYHGTWVERDVVRRVFRDELKHQVIGTCYRDGTEDKGYNPGTRVIEWVNPLYNTLGQLDFKCMELPKSIHLSRKSYPHWKGLDWNGIDVNPLEEMMTDADE